MNWNEKTLDKMKLENIDNVEAKKKVAEMVAQKVKDGQVIRIWLWFDLFYSNSCNCRKNKE